MTVADHSTGASAASIYSNTAGSSTLVERAFFDATGLSINPTGTGGGATGAVRLLELAANGSDYVEHRAADSVTASYSITWPGAAPTGSTSYSTSNWVPSITSAGVVAYVKAMEVFTVNSPLQLSGGQLDLLTVGLGLGGTGSALSDPGGHRLMAWDDTDGAVKFITIGSGLSYDAGTDTLTASGAGLPAVDTTSIVEGSADGTKEVRIEADGITTGTIRVWTAPDANTTIPIFSQVVTFNGPSTARTYTLPDANSVLAASDSVNSFTNKSIDVEGTGNNITTVGFVEFPLAIAAAGTGVINLDSPSSNAPAAAVIAGTNTLFAVADFDAATDESVQGSFKLPSDWSGAIDFDGVWYAAATSGSAVFALQCACVADAETGDPSFNAAQTITDAAKGTTNQFNDFSLSSVTTTGCAAGETFFFRFSRDADNGSDDMTGDARVKTIRFKIRRNQ
jgi:hypothetical protein